MRSPFRLPLAAALVFASAAAFAAAPAAGTAGSKAATPAPMATAAPSQQSMPAMPGDEGAAIGVTGAAAGPFMTATPYKSEHVACRQVVLSWPTASSNPLAGGGMSSTTVTDEGGTSGLRFFVDRAHGGAVLAVQTFRGENTGFMEATTLPGSPRIDYVDCMDGDTLGGIVIEWYDVKGE